MKEVDLKEVRFNNTHIELSNNHVVGNILPEKIAELTRTIAVQENSIIDGAVYAQKLVVKNGDLDVRGAVFAQLELYVDSDAKGDVIFRKCVGSADSISSRAGKCDVTFGSDINAKTVSLYNAFVAGSIYADEVVLENCVVIGGVFATQQLDATNTIMGTFNAPVVSLSQNIYLLLPSAFSMEKAIHTPDTHLYNLALADLGALYKGLPESPQSGCVPMSLESDEIKASLVDDKVMKVLRAYTIVGKVLAADLVDIDKFQNHFLLTAASLGTQLLRSYDLGPDSNGKLADLSLEKLRKFFFDILHGKIHIQKMDGKFEISQITGR